MSAFERLRERRRSESGPLIAMSAAGQLGFGILKPAFEAGIARRPHYIGCDMGSVDPGPYYLGAGVMAPGAAMARQDLRLVLTAARKLDVPLLIGSAGTAGAAPHVAATVAMVREIAAAEGLHFTLGILHADVAAAQVIAAERAGQLEPLGRIPVPSEDEIAQSRIVGQMGTEAFGRALLAGADVVIAGRACDTAIFATIPQLLGYPMGPATHMAKIIECTSIACIPGGRDTMLGFLDGDGFVLESMNPDRHATPLSVAAHALYEQSDPHSVAEPDGTLFLQTAEYVALDHHRTRVSGATWQDATRRRVKIEGALRQGGRAVMLAASADPGFISGIQTHLADVERIARDLVPQPFQLFWRVYGQSGAGLWPGPAAAGEAPEAFILVECVAETASIARGALSVFRQYLLHHGFPGRLSTGGNLAFPLTPPEIEAGDAYRFSLYHLMPADHLEDMFPLTMETI